MDQAFIVSCRSDLAFFGLVLTTPVGKRSPPRQPLSVMKFGPDDFRHRCEPARSPCFKLPSPGPAGHKGDSEPKPRKMRESHLHVSEVDEIFTRARQDDGSEKRKFFVLVIAHNQFCRRCVSQSRCGHGVVSPAEYVKFAHLLVLL